QRHAAWTVRGRHGDRCPRRPLPRGHGWRRAAGRAAAAAEDRRSRPILFGIRWAAHDRRVTYACGPRAARRSAVVSLSLSGFYPSASLSDRVVAVARFRGRGWRVWLLLH